MGFDSTQTIDFIADHSKDLAKMAEGVGQEALAYLLRMAELEARTVGAAKAARRRVAA